MAALDPNDFMVTQEAVQAFFYPLAEILFDPVTHEFDEDNGRRIFNEVMLKSFSFIEFRVAELGGTADDLAKANLQFTQSLEASFRALQ